MSLILILIIVAIVAIIVYGYKNNKLEEVLEFGIGGCATIGGLIWKIAIASASDNTMYKWAERAGRYRQYYEQYATQYKDYYNVRANAVLVIGIILLAVGIYRLKQKNNGEINLVKKVNNVLANSNLHKSANSSSTVNAKIDTTKKLKDLKDLLDSGAITEEEFTKKKQELLEKI